MQTFAIKSFAEFFAQAEKKIYKFSAGMCAWRKIHLWLQVWNLLADGEQIMRAADCKKLEEKPDGIFLQRQAARPSPRCLSY